MYKYLGFLDGIFYKVKMRRKLYKKVLLNTIKARNGFQTKNLRKQYINLPLESQNTDALIRELPIKISIYCDLRLMFHPCASRIKHTAPSFKFKLLHFTFKCYSSTEEELLH